MLPRQVRYARTFIYVYHQLTMPLCIYLHYKIYINEAKKDSKTYLTIDTCFLLLWKLNTSNAMWHVLCYLIQITTSNVKWERDVHCEIVCEYVLCYQVQTTTGHVKWVHQRVVCMRSISNVGRRCSVMLTTCVNATIRKLISGMKKLWLVKKVSNILLWYFDSE